MSNSHGRAFDVRSYDSADSFLAALSPSLWTGGLQRWLFRGQAKADWPLRASAVRETDAFRRYGIDLDCPRDTTAWSARKDRQDALLEAFRRGLDEAGIVIPAASPRVLSTIETSSIAEPLREAFPLMALAQHHGLPTMLLDWTMRGRFAAYFAAADAAGREERDGQLAVWALKLNESPATFLAGYGWLNDRDRLEVYQAPGGTNPNMRAQAGHFTLVSSELDTSIDDFFARWVDVTGKPSPLIKLTVAAAEANRLLRLLAYEGVDGASMFPGADGVVRAMRERALWDTE
jgi:hypothetical protein